ncbi:MAG: hypothetical protein ABSA70_16445 [Terriglobia bacterium]
MLNTEAWIKRADEVIANISEWNYSEGLLFATSMITAFYGPDGPQMKTFRETTEGIYRGKASLPFPLLLKRHAKATIQNIRAEIEGGLIKSVRVLLTGEIVAELLALAREIMADGSEAAKNVSAVLVAAAFEDLIRRMGLEFAGVTARPKLEEVISTLKQNNVLKGGEVTTALGYLKFRNDSLHADWKSVERSQVQSCLAFVEALLVKHFS